MREKIISSKQLDLRPAEPVNAARISGRRTVVTHHGRPVAVIGPFSDLKVFAAEAARKRRARRWSASDLELLTTNLTTNLGKERPR